MGTEMDCPVCGCRVEPGDPQQLLLECCCCGSVWVRTSQDDLERVLIGPED